LINESAALDRAADFLCLSGRSLLFADGGGRNEPRELQSAAVRRRRTARLRESQ